MVSAAVQNLRVKKVTALHGSDIPISHSTVGKEQSTMSPEKKYLLDNACSAWTGILIQPI